MSFLHRTPSPSAVPATPAQTHAPPPTAIDPSAETSSFLDRMHETFHPSHQQTQAQAPLAPALPPQAHHQDAGRPKAEEDSLLDKLTSKLSLSDSHPAPPVAPPAAPVHTASSSSGFLHRLADKLESSGDKEAAAAVPVSPAPPRKADGTIWDGLGFGGSDRPATPPPAPKGTLERLGDKVKDAVGAGGEEKKDKHAVPSAKKGEGLLAKLNEAAGGGVSGEEREDALDKSIDWVQKVMGSKTDQSNESAAEQAADRVIATAIRNQYETMTGKKFPIHEKKH